MATYIPEVVRLTYQVGLNSRLRIAKQGMTEDEHDRGHGPSPIEARRILTNRVQDPCGCHASGIPSMEASSPPNLSDGFDIHHDCPRVFRDVPIGPQADPYRMGLGHPLGLAS